MKNAETHAKGLTWSELRYLVFSDLYRITGRFSPGLLLRHLLIGESFKYIFWMRVRAYFRSGPRMFKPLYVFSWLMLRHYTYKLGISVPAGTQIGPGFYIGHFGSIIVSGYSRLGRNVNLSHGVTLGRTSRGKHAGAPVIGDNVYIGPGAKIVGGVRIGNNVAIGANCVVASDVEDDAVVVGIPGRRISSAGSAGYITRTDYDSKWGTA